MNFDEKKEILRKAYKAFNDRDVEKVLETLDPAVDWPNGMEGGIEHGHDAVRAYWIRQWIIINPYVEPIEFKQEESGRINVLVHQVVYDMSGTLLIDQVLHHIYSFSGRLVKSMEIK